jgi:tetratricopeptide (TPR) repeat protein
LPLLAEHVEQVPWVEVARARGPQEQLAWLDLFCRRAVIDHRSSLVRFFALSFCGQDRWGRIDAAPWQATCFCGGGPRNFGSVTICTGAAVDDGQALLERDAALARIDQRQRDAIAGRGSLLLLEGPAGIGKTRLVLAAGWHGHELGLTTLSARGSELERDFAYGLVRQLFEAPVVAASPPERAEFLAGAAGHSARLFGLPAARDDPADALLDPSFAILHGLYWLSANLGRRSPLLLCVDDVHWADQASVRFLHYLGRRLQELPIAVVAATRPARSADGSPLLAALAADPSAEVLELAPLSHRAVAELMRLAFGAEVEPAFAAACHEVTGGVPFLVRELVRAIAEERIEPTSAACSRVAGLAPRAVSHSVVQRLSRLSASARQLARAAAVLGEGDLRLAADLAGVDPATAATAADELAAAEILEEGRPLRFVHPIVRAAAEADLSPGERAGLHAAAADCLANEGASPHRIAAHLLATDPAGDDRVAGSLLSAARTATANGAPDSAVAYLRRGLSEPPSVRLRPDVLLELGFAESYAGDPQAAAHLQAALDIAPATTAQVSITLALGRMLQIAGRNRESLEVFDRTRARLGATDRSAALTLEGAALGAAQFDAETAGDAAQRIARLRRLAEEEPDVPPSVFGGLVPCRTCSGCLATAPCITCGSATSPTPTPTRAWRWRPDPGCPACTPPSPSPLCSRRSPSARNSRRPRRPTSATVSPSSSRPRCRQDG